MSNPRKQFTTLRARAAFFGWQLWQTVEDEVSPETYFAKRGRQVFHLPTMDDVEAFMVENIGQATP